MDQSEDKFLERLALLSLFCLLLAGAYFIKKAPQSLSPQAQNQGNHPYTGIFSTIGSEGYGRNSATKAAMQNLKTALVNYNNDVGFYPHTGTTRNPRNYFSANEDCLGATFPRNVLVATDVGYPFELGGLSSETYGKRWKGPYMDANPDEFMMDAWDNKIIYTFFEGALYFHSSGKNGVFDLIDRVLAPSYEGDDILMRVSRVKKMP